MTNREKALDLAMRVLAVTMLSVFAYRVCEAELRRPSLILATLLVSEVLIVMLVIFSKMTNTRLFSPVAVISTAAATFYFLLIQLDSGARLVPTALSETIMLVGMVIQITAKFYLGRNFGLLPAMRGIVTSGPYRFVRHPIYLGYLVTHFGFLLNMFSMQNMLILTLLYILQLLRVFNEEKVLSRSADYRAYMAQVPKRFIPFVA